MDKKRGRPVKDNGRSNDARVRLTESEARMLEDLCDEYGVSKSEIFRMGLRTLHLKNRGYFPWNNN